MLASSLVNRLLVFPSRVFLHPESFTKQLHKWILNHVEHPFLLPLAQSLLLIVNGIDLINSKTAIPEEAIPHGVYRGQKCKFYDMACFWTTGKSSSKVWEHGMKVVEPIAKKQKFWLRKLVTGEKVINSIFISVPLLIILGITYFTHLPAANFTLRN